MSVWLSIGNLLVLTLLVLFWLSKPNRRLESPNHVSWFTFVAILFTSGLDVGLIMFPLTEFPVYSDIDANPEYGFANPLSIAFGFWGFLVWGIYFVTCYYFAVVEPKLRFFEIPLIKKLNNVLILATCAFTAYLLLVNLPWYIPQLEASYVSSVGFPLIVMVVVLLAVLSSTKLIFLKVLSLSSVGLFFALILMMAINAKFVEANAISVWLTNMLNVSDYFSNISVFVLPVNAYHEFYLYWWFAWSIMIGQFTARFVQGMSTNGLLAAMLIFPSLTILAWFSLLYTYFTMDISTIGFVNTAMAAVGIVFVVNSLDSLIRLYSDNMGLTVAKLGQFKYLTIHFLLLCLLIAIFSFDFLQIQWIGAIVIGLFVACIFYGIHRLKTIKRDRT